MDQLQRTVEDHRIRELVDQEQARNESLLQELADVRGAVDDLKKLVGTQRTQFRGMVDSKEIGEADSFAEQSSFSGKGENELNQEGKDRQEESLGSSIPKREDRKKAQTRYWQPEEHQRFLEALEKFGPRDVRSISGYVATRSPTQVRTHSQKYFLRVAKEVGSKTSGTPVNIEIIRNVSEGDLAKLGRELVVARSQNSNPKISRVQSRAAHDATNRRGLNSQSIRESVFGTMNEMNQDGHSNSQEYDRSETTIVEGQEKITYDANMDSRNQARGISLLSLVASSTDLPPYS